MESSPQRFRINSFGGFARQGDRAALGCAYTGANPLTVCLRQGSAAGNPYSSCGTLQLKAESTVEVIAGKESRGGRCKSPPSGKDRQCLEALGLFITRAARINIRSANQIRSRSE